MEAMVVDKVVDFPDPLIAVTQVKSTLILSSVESVRSYGVFERYRKYLDNRYAQDVLESVVGAWLPVDAALAHYKACDELMLTAEQQLQLGRITGHGIRQHLTRVAGMLSRGLGVTPWLMFEQFPRLWKRSFDGGGIAVRRHGPKEAEITYTHCKLLESPYFRGALRGVAVGLLESATRRCLMNELPARNGKMQEARYRISWV
jgi:hypothetical protein